MTSEERADFLLLKARLELYLENLNEEIITFDIDGDDAEFKLLIRKAEYYLGILERVNYQLTNE